MRATAESALTAVALLEGLSPAALPVLERVTSEVAFDTGAELLRRGEEADVFYAIRHGSVLLEAYVPARGPVPVETLEAGEVLGLSWLHPPHRWQLDARALTPVRATAFDAVALREALARDPALGYEVMSRLTRPLLERLQWTRLRLLDVYRADERR